MKGFVAKSPSKGKNPWKTGIRESRVGGMHFAEKVSQMALNHVLTLPKYNLRSAQRRPEKFVRGEVVEEYQIGWIQYIHRYIYIYIYILEIKARQRRAKRNINLMLVASRMKAGHPWFSRQCSNSWSGLVKGWMMPQALKTNVRQSVFHRQRRPSAARQGQVNRNPTRAAFGRPPFILIIK